MLTRRAFLRLAGLVAGYILIATQDVAGLLRPAVARADDSQAGQVPQTVPMLVAADPPKKYLFLPLIARD